MAKGLVATKVDQAARHPGIVKEALIAVRMGGTNRHNFHLAIPIGCGGNRAGVSAKSDQRSRIGKFFATELTNVELVANRAHFGETCIADMRIVSPDNSLRLSTMGIQDVA